MAKVIYRRKDLFELMVSEDGKSLWQTKVMEAEGS